MISRIFRLISAPSLRYPWIVLGIVTVLTVVLGFNIRNLRLTTSLTDLLGQGNPQWEAVRNYTQHSGYGNQLFVIVESEREAEQASEEMEATADQLVAEMNASGYFTSTRCSVSEKELLKVVRLFAWNFPSFVEPGQIEKLKAHLSDAGIKAAIARGQTGLVTAFSSLGSHYFVIDPLGITEVLTPANSATTLFDMDLTWGSGNYFYSKDHRALLVLAEPKPSGMNYQSAQEIMKWTRDRCASHQKKEGAGGNSLRLTPAGALVYAEQDRAFIEKNINLVSTVSIVANLLLCLLVYRRIPIFVMSFVPTFLGLIWTTGVVGYYPGELNLISLAFIAILVGLGDDNIVHFFNRVPQEWTGGNSLHDAMAKTIETTGRSIILCIVTTGTATLALTTANFKGLSEFGLVLSMGLLMLLIHTLFTVPAMMHLWWRFFPPSAPQSTTFRFLPSIALVSAKFVFRYARVILWSAVALLIMAFVSLSSLKMDRQVQIDRSNNNPAVLGQQKLSEKFSVAGTPGLILIQGSQEGVLAKAEEISLAFEDLKARGIIKSVFSPSALIPSQATQIRRAKALSSIDLERVALVLERSLAKAGFNLDYFKSALENLRGYAVHGPRTLTAEEVLSSLPAGLLENSIQRIGNDEYLAAVAYYSSNAAGMEEIPEEYLTALHARYDPFIEFSYPKMNRELQRQVFQDNRRALLLTLLGVVLIVFCCFRSLRMMLLVLVPIGFAISVTFFVLIAARHNFSFMALTAIPLIIGLGIDNGIHIARRFRERKDNDIVEILKDSGAALLQSNLTTILGFGALIAASFEPLAELGLVTAIGVGFTLVGAMLLMPAMVIVFRIRP
jgi:uncharacterized protein